MTFNGSETAFLLTMFAALAALFGWAFTRLPGENWQIVATVPRTRAPDGSWQGLNLTYYGLFVATATTLATAHFLLLARSVDASLPAAAAVTAATLAVSLPAARWIARLVEKKSHTFTVSGATFAGFVVLPWLLLLLPLLPAPWLRQPLPVIPTLAAVAISYALGESLGRLACISFGCCYGRRISDLPPRLQRAFRHIGVVFRGETKKITYEGGLSGEKVVPIQAITALLYGVTALAGTGLFLAGRYRLAFVGAVAVTQLWRLASEGLRCDHRGCGRITTYQIFSLLMVAYALAWAWVAPAEVGGSADIGRGLHSLWNSGCLIGLQCLWGGVFLYMGRSQVTTSHIAFRVVREHV